MSEISQPSSNLASDLAAQPAADRVFRALKEARSQIEAIEQARNERVAIVGIAGRFPGADNLAEFLELLNQGKSGIVQLSDAELLAAGVPESTFNQPNYVRAYASFSDPTEFDAQFFGYAPREAELMDPQHRVFLECAWSALEDAGYDSQQYDGTIGVYGGAALNSYIVNLHSNPAVREALSPVQAVVSNVMGLMPTRVSYQLDLKGPSCGIQTGCSTALVAIHTACQSLLNHECDLALAGGVTISCAQPQGYFYQSEGIVSPDGTCRAFDEAGQGTVFGNGVGIVVLKRLQAALVEGDHIYAVIRGSAVNNDGADKVNLIAPSVSGQAAVITSALEQAGVAPETVRYVEAHGTGTPLGDPIEVAALNKAYGNGGRGDRKLCALGSVKTNLGHLDAAAGAAGVIKAALSLYHKTLFASLHYRQPNPQIDFQNGPFVVDAQRADWPADETPRRAGVSSFGMGGTNAHAILEEAPEICSSGEARPWQLLVLSAKTPTALANTVKNLAAHLQRYPELCLADVAYTLQVGRRAWPHRYVCLAQTTTDAVERLRQVDADREFKAIAPSSPASVVFMFSGQGSQHIDMARGLYDSEPVFRQHVDQCAQILAGGDFSLLELLYPTKTSSVATAPLLNQTAYTQPALFAIEYALAKLWMSWGIQPQALIGHSVGEYVAACLAGVFSLEDALPLMVQRGQLMQRCQPGSMLSVFASAASLQPQLPAEAEIAVINSPQNCVVSGPTPVMTQLQQQLEAQGLVCRLLVTSHAFHSAMMTPALEGFAKALQKVHLSPPHRDIISNVTGTWLTDAEAIDPGYWVRHLRSTVRFSQGLTELLQLPNPVLLEVGPGHSLVKLAQQHRSLSSASDASNATILQSLPHPQSAKNDTALLMETVGALWQTGTSVTWAKLHHGANRHRLPLPTYPFERKSYWVPLLPDEQKLPAEENLSFAQASKPPKAKAADLADWFYLPTWKRLPLTASGETAAGDRWLIFANETLQTQLSAYFLASDLQPDVTWAKPGLVFSAEGDRYEINPQSAADYQQLIQALCAQGLDHPHSLSQVVYGWPITESVGDEAVPVETLDNLKSLLYLTQALAQSERTVTLSVVTMGVHDISGSNFLNPAMAKVSGFCQVIPQEYPALRCRLIDIELETLSSASVQDLGAALMSPYNPQQRQIAYRQRQRWVQGYEPLPLPEVSPALLKRNGTYVIAGDLVEGLGMVYAQALVKDLNARVILLGSPGLPAVQVWEKWLITHSPQHGVSRLIHRLQSLGREGEQFLWFSGDLANADWVSASIHQGIAHWGDITGVFHAGVMGDRASCPIAELSDEESDRICRTKVEGIQALQQALSSHPVAFYVLQSSLATVVGGMGFGAYAAANSYLDALANQQNSMTTRWLSLNWDACQLDETVGTATEAASELMALAISAPEVWQATQRALAQPGLSQLVISPRDLADRLTEAFTPVDRAANQIDNPIDRASQTERDSSGSSASATALPATHARPVLATTYVAPRNPIEQRVAQEMGDLLGIEAVGIHDNFFELGGHSLLAIQAVTRLRQTFQVELPMRAFLFEAPTVAGIAKTIEENQMILSAETQATLEDLLDHIEEMTPEEVEQRT
jgi:acyl transferase domain-containing protein